MHLDSKIIFSTHFRLYDYDENGADIEASVSEKEIPKFASLIAGQSFAPSPTIAQTIFIYFNDLIIISLCSGLHLPNKVVEHINLKMF